MGSELRIAFNCRRLMCPVECLDCRLPIPRGVRGGERGIRSGDGADYMSSAAAFTVFAVGLFEQILWPT